MTEESRNARPRYAIIAALEYEEELLRNEMKDRCSSTLLGTPVFTGTIGNNDVVLMRSGMGKVSAGIGAQVLIDRFHPDYIINTGCAGALDKALGIGDTVISDCVVEWDLDLRAIGFPLGYIDALKCVEMQADAALADQMQQAVSGNVRRGLIVSGDQFVSTDAQRQTIRQHFPNALCAEMEGAAIGHVCRQNGIPFCILRTMSDTADGDSGVDFAAFSKVAGEQSAAFLLEMLRKA